MRHRRTSSLLWRRHKALETLVCLALLLAFLPGPSWAARIKAKVAPTTIESRLGRRNDLLLPKHTQPSLTKGAASGHRGRIRAQQAPKKKHRAAAATAATGPGRAGRSLHVAPAQEAARVAAMLPDVRSAPPLPGGIPRIMHQMFYPGREELLKAEAAPRGAFRRDWRRSCQVHNPSWQYILWDLALSEALLEQRYAWFLDTFRAMTSWVVKSDAMRPFILHAYGGVYMDMDIECFGALDALFAGHSLVLQAQSPALVNNGQMASVVGHPLWPLLQQRAAVKCKETIGKRLDPDVVMMAVGPGALTEEFKKYLHINSSQLPGSYPDPGWAASPLNKCSTSPGGATCDKPATIQVYAPKQWFEACTWDDLGCQVMFAECSPFLRALNAARTSANAQPLHPGLPQPSKLMLDILRVAPSPYTEEANKVLVSPERHQLSKCLLTWGALAGVHQFSGSWLDGGGFKSQKHKEEVADRVSQGLARFFGSADYFVELKPRQTPTTPTPTPTATRRLQAASHTAQEATSHTAQEAVSHTAARSLAGDTPAGARRLGAQEAQHARAALPGWLAGVLAPLKNLHVMRERVGGGRSGCHVMSMTLFRTASQGGGSAPTCCTAQQPEFQSQSLSDLAGWAAGAGCHLHVLTDGTPATHPVLAHVAGLPRAKLVGEALVLPGPGGPGEEEDAAYMARTALAVALRMWKKQNPNSRMTVLHLSAPGSCVWSMIKQMNTPGVRGLVDIRPQILVLDVGTLMPSSRTVLQPAYQHLYQELGYQGHYHQGVVGAAANATTQEEGWPGACSDCFARAHRNSSGEVPLLPALRLALVIPKRFLWEPRHK